MSLQIHSLPDIVRGIRHFPELFSFEEMLALSDEARIVALRANGIPNRSVGPSTGAWLEISPAPNTIFGLLAAHPHLLDAAQQMINGPVRVASLRIWVGGAGQASPALPASGGATALIGLSGSAQSASVTLDSGSAYWLEAGETISLTADSSLAMLCAISYDTCEAATALHAAATDCLWPSAYVSAG